MLEIIFDILKQLGIAGLIMGIGVEALSVPFPAAIVFLLYGYVMQPSGLELVWISLGASAAYTAIAYIPYLLSVKFKYLVQRRVQSGRAQRMVSVMEKYGGWTIAGGRVLGMGYIVYVASFCRISPLRYGIFTFIGIVPVALSMLYLGGLGNVEAVYTTFQNVQYLVMGVLAAALAYYIYYRVKRRKEARPGEVKY
jgi:membrane protein DedA with SNARE-associated domain